MEVRSSGGAELVLTRFRPWFYAAALYNLAWGTAIILFPGALFDVLNIERPNYLPIWQVVGMFVLVYAPAYWWAGRHPDRYPQIIVIGLLGKLLGPIGFLWSAAVSDFPWIFGVTIITNDLIWWPAAVSHLWEAAVLKGAQPALLKADLSWSYWPATRLSSSTWSRQ